VPTGQTRRKPQARRALAAAAAAAKAEELKG